uniref:WD repeat domain phosphoinositide-interacting protein 2 n=1 Tax=Meloidogyne floridensis TaxID=298350 RepID=A0A915NIP2_9BILA
MYSSAAEFITNQINPNSLWNFAETSVQYTQHLFGQYLSPTPAILVDEMDIEQTPGKKIYSISFNQDCTSLAVGHEDGYSFYSLRSIDKLEKIQDAKAPERACIVEKLFNSSLITVVSMKSTRKLQVYHSSKENEICSHTYASSIIAVRMNRKRVVVCLEDAIHIHNVRDMRILHMIKDTPSNPQGIVDLSIDDNNCFLAFPASSSTGHNLITVCQITAHDSVLAAVRFNPEGNKLATGSEKGTVIRVFSITGGERLFEFVRGVSRCVQISSLAFSQDSRFLCLSSNTETVHVFSLAKRDQQLDHHTKPDDSSQESVSWMSYFSQQASAYLPQQVNDLMLRGKSVAVAKLPILGHKTVVAMPKIQGIDYLIVASMEGYLFWYSLPTSSDVSECKLLRQYKIGPKKSSKKDGDEGEIGGIQISTPQKNLEPELQNTPARFSQTSGSIKTSSGSPSLFGTSSTSVKLQQQLHSASNTPKVLSTPKPLSSKDLTKVVDANPFNMEDLVTPLDEDEIVNLEPVKIGSTVAVSSPLNLPPADLDDLEEFPPLKNSTS